MTPYTFHTFTPGDVNQVNDLQQAYCQVYSGAVFIMGEYYLSPAFHSGKNVFCAFESTPEGERMVAYAPVYIQLVENGPAGLPHRVWTEIKARPGLPETEQVKDALLEQVVECAKAGVSAYPGRETQLIFEYHLNETPAIAYVLSRGFAHIRSVFMMRRDLKDAIPSKSVPEGINIRRWKMESTAEQQAYVDARNECFPEAPISLGEWQYYMGSPMWAAGTMIAAFDGAELVGGVNVYWNPGEDQTSLPGAGMTEDIFVRPGWRGKGIAGAMISEGMRFLKEHGLVEARLGVAALNKNALGLYLGLGYQVVEESRHYARNL